MVVFGSNINCTSGHIQTKGLYSCLKPGHPDIYNNFGGRCQNSRVAGKGGGGVGRGTGNNNLLWSDH